MLLGRIASSRLARVLPPAALLAATLCLSLVGFPLFWFSPGSVLTLAGLFVTGLGIGGVYPLGVSAAIAGGGQHRRGRREARRRRGRRHPRGPTRPGGPGRQVRHRFRLRYRDPHAPRGPVPGARRGTKRSSKRCAEGSRLDKKQWRVKRIAEVLTSAIRAFQLVSWSALQQEQRPEMLKC